MNMPDFVIEICATSIESFIVMFAISKLCGKKRFTGSAFVGSVLLLSLTSALNVCSLFSYVTIAMGLVATTIYAKVTTTGSFALCFLSSVLTFLVIHSIDYLVFSAFEAIKAGTLSETFQFSQLISPGTSRTIYLVVDKGLDLLVYITFRPFLAKLQSLSKKYIRLLCLFGGTIYAVMTLVLSMMLSNSPATLRTAVSLTWVLLVACVGMAITIFWVQASYQTERETNQLLNMSNSMLEENYENLRRLQDESAKQRHDFNNHIELICELTATGKYEEIREYADSLLLAAREMATLCHNGNNIIDAIINCKFSEAERRKIAFTYNINFSIPTNIRPIDLCSILANQIDNAFEACVSISAPAKRKVDVHIWQKTGNLAIIQVSNTVESNPLIVNPQLLSTKTDQSRPHGLGIKSIRDTAKKYNGVLENNFQDGKFISTVLLSYSPTFAPEKEESSHATRVCHKANRQFV